MLQYAFDIPRRRWRRPGPLVLIAGLVISLIGVPVAGGAQPTEEISVPLSATSTVYAVEHRFLVEAAPATLPDHLEPRSIGFGFSEITDSRPGSPTLGAVRLAAELGIAVEPSYVRSLGAVNPEPRAADQWYHENFGQFGGTPDADLDTPEAWDVTMGDGAVIAIVDSGADVTHPDIAPNLWVNPGEIAGNGIDDDGNGFVDDVSGWSFVTDDADLTDLIGHGTGVASLAAGPIDGSGIAGVAPEARLMVLRACGFAGCFDPDVIAALDYAVAMGADVVNLSLGQDGPRPIALEAAIQATIDAGVVVVAAAGNGGDDLLGDNNDLNPVWPASFDVDGLLSVAATDDDDGLTSFSNYGATTVDVAAPGADVLAAVPGDSWAFVAGTSYSSPITAGVAALIVASDACATPARIDGLVEARGDAIPSHSGLTISGRRVNALRSLWSAAIADEAVGGVAPFAVSFSGGTAGTTWDFDDGQTATGASPHHVFSQGVYEVTNDTSSAVYEVAAGIAFTDVCNSIFRAEIAWQSALGIASGCSPDEFCPKDALTRAQMATFLAVALQLPAATQDYFTDDDGSVHEPNINRITEAGIASGCDTDEFCPSDSVTRAQTATFFARGFGLAGGPDAFADDNGSPHEPNINALAASGITGGCDVGLFCPGDPISREQMAAFFFRGRDFLPG